MSTPKRVRPRTSPTERTTPSKMVRVGIAPDPEWRWELPTSVPSSVRMEEVEDRDDVDVADIIDMRDCREEDAGGSCPELTSLVSDVVEADEADEAKDER